MDTRQQQVEWLKDIDLRIMALAEELKNRGDGLLPRGFALGCVNDAVSLLDQAHEKLAQAVVERLGMRTTG